MFAIVCDRKLRVRKRGKTRRGQLRARVVFGITRRAVLVPALSLSFSLSLLLSIVPFPGKFLYPFFFFLVSPIYFLGTQSARYRRTADRQINKERERGREREKIGEKITRDGARVAWGTCSLRCALRNAQNAARTWLGCMHTRPVLICDSMRLGFFPGTHARLCGKFSSPFLEIERARENTCARFVERASFSVTPSARARAEKRIFIFPLERQITSRALRGGKRNDDNSFFCVGDP